MGAVISKLCCGCLPTKSSSSHFNKKNSSTTKTSSRIPSLIIQRSQLLNNQDEDEGELEEVRTEYSRILERDFEIRGRRVTKSHLRGSNSTSSLRDGTFFIKDSSSDILKEFQLIHKESGKPFTLTRITKSLLTRTEAESLCREIRLLADRLPHHPLLVNLYWTWQDEVYLYRIDDLVTGADGEEVLIPRDLKELGKWASQLALAVHYIHSYGLVHGNINPRSIFLSNSSTSRDILLGSFKHLRRLESGGKKLTGQCGDYEEFRAPEEEYFEEIDWYAYGRTLSVWRNQQLEYANGSGCDDLNDLIYRLTVLEPEGRLGYGPGAFKSIQSHAFFAQTDWSQLLGLSTTATRTSFSSLSASIDSLKRATSSASTSDWKEFLEFSWDLEGQIGQTLESLYRREGAIR